MSSSKKFILILSAIVIFIAMLYFMLDPEEFRDFWKFIGACIVLIVIFLIAWANGNSPADRSRDTIDWEMEQERLEKEREEEELRQRHKDNK